MKKTIGLTAALAAIVFLLFYLNTWSPFFGIKGKSMEPNLKVGDLVFIEQVSPGEIKEGDIIVFSVPGAVREYYNYPLVVAHRVKEVAPYKEDIVFRTKGDNTGEDPFAVRTTDLKGIVGKKISYLGFPLLFLQSKQGLISITVIFLLISLGSYGLEIGRIKRKVQKEIFSPVLEGQQETKQALNGFASAMAEYGQHLKSHTSAVQALATAAQKLSEITERLGEKLDDSTKKSG